VLARSTVLFIREFANSPIHQFANSPIRQFANSDMVTAHNVATTTHGRYLIEEARRDPPAGLLVGFHGYGEAAEAQLDRLRSVPGAEDWLLVSVQGLHRFYNRRSQDVVASWMTRQDRELAMADNLRYVRGVVDAIGRSPSAPSQVVFAGFSQGAAMAFRAACDCPRGVPAVVAVGGDVPPELDASALARVKRAFLARGDGDEWYTDEKLLADEQRLTAAGVAVRTFRHRAGHEWSADVSAAVDAFLRDVRVNMTRGMYAP
jgi:predicted esterase